MELVLMALILAAVLAAQYLVYKKYALRGVTYTLTLSKTEVFEGDEFEAVEEIENAKWLPLPWVRTEISCSRRLSFVGASQETADKIRECKARGGRVIAVGTTSCRTLESAAQLSADGTISACTHDTGIFIYPGYEFKCIDGLITNFHLPESTLIMLVSAFLGRERTLHAYDVAIKERYRFFSFGDSMIII